jgi:hypothetical protein
MTPHFGEDEPGYFPGGGIEGGFDPYAGYGWVYFGVG